MSIEKSNQKANETRMAVLGMMQSLFERGHGSDVTVRCGRREWELHSGILASRCDFFLVACEGLRGEKRTGVIEMNDDNEFALGALLMFLYTGEYTRDCYFGQTHAMDADTSVLLLLKYHAEVVSLADKYRLPALKELATLYAKLCAGLLLARQG